MLSLQRLIAQRCSARRYVLPADPASPTASDFLSTQSSYNPISQGKVARWDNYFNINVVIFLPYGPSKEGFCRSPGSHEDWPFGHPLLVCTHGWKIPREYSVKNINSTSANRP